MFGFRQKLSAQDVLLQLKEQVIDHLSRTTPKAILALDVKGAFDNVTHQAILENLNQTHCGSKAFNYVKAFLGNRTATIKLGQLVSPTFNTPANGTPQGSVISPLLFNIALLALPQKLNAIANLKHAFYADDLTLWTVIGSSKEQQDGLQQAVDETISYLQPRGLTCEPSKSALLILRARTRGRLALRTQTSQFSGSPFRKCEHLKFLACLPTMIIRVRLVTATSQNRDATYPLYTPNTRPKARSHRN